MALNFDAQINLDVGPFLASIERAKGAVKGLNAELNAIANRKINVQVQVAKPNAAAMAATPAAAAANPFQNAKAASNGAMQAERTTRNLNAARDEGVRGLARERYALYDVAAAYQQVSQIAFGAVKAMSGAAISYERAFANVIRTTDFTSIKDRFDMSNQFKDLNEAARAMKYSLTQVAAEIPVAFGKITEIATIGNQLGIAQGKLQSFTKTVAQFATITGMTTDATAMGFGRIGELLDEGDYAKLGSAIAFAGVKAVATEEQIASVTKEIATTAKMAKFSTPEVVGLATALSSVGIAPEAARGSIIRTFAGINQAVSEGGANLQNYASISGMSAEEFSKSWTDNGQVAFDSFLKGLKGMSDGGQNLDTVLRSIGLKNVRDIQTIQKLGDNYNVYAEGIRNANSAYAEGTFLSEAYGVIQDTVAAKIELLQNNFQNLMASLGEGTTGELFKGILDGLNGFLKTLNDAARNPFVRDWVMPVITSLVAAVGAFASINAVVALGKAALLAYGTAMGVVKVGADGATGAINKTAIASTFLNTAFKSVAWIAAITVIIDGLSRLSAALAPVEQKAESLLGGFSGLQDAFTSDTKALEENAAAAGMTAQAYANANGIILVNTGNIEGNDQAAKDAKAAHDNLVMIVGNEPGAFSAATGAIGNQTIAIGNNTVAWLKNAMVQSESFRNIAKNKGLAEALKSGGYSFDAALKAVAGGTGDAYFKTIEDKLKSKTFTGGIDWPWNNWVKFFNYNGIVGDLNKIKDTLTGSYNEVLLLGLGNQQAADKATGAWKPTTEQLKNLNKATKEAVRTVVDYASDLIGIFNRIDSISFSRQTGLDEIADGWKDLSDKAADADKAIKSAEATIAGIKADKSILEYQLTVATRYGDMKRVASLNAQIAKKNQELADAEKSKADATDAANKSLDVNTKGTAANRAAMIDMLSKYKSYIEALAATGMKGTALENAVTDLKKGFTEQGTAIGYNSDELKLYTDQFDQYAKAVHDTPRDVTIEFDANKTSEFNAVQEYLAKEHKLFVKVVRSDDGTLNSIAADAGVPGVAGGSGGGGGTPPVVNKLDTAAEAKTALNAKIKDLDAAAKATPSYQGAVILGTQITIAKKLLADLITADNNLTKNKNLSYQGAIFYSNQRAKIIAAIAKGDFSGKYASGGFVKGPGSGTSDSIPAMLSNGEYVINAGAVRSYGVDFMNSLNQMKVGQMPASSGSALGGSSSSIVYLSPDDRALLRAAIDRPVNLFADSTKIASTANTGNVLLAQRGLN